jgi:hypothetical protein
MVSDISEPAVAIETANRHTSIDMTGLLSYMRDGATLNTQVANTCIPAGERLNKMSKFVSCFRETHAFLAWLRASCPGGLTTQLKREKLIVVPSTANGFRDAVSALLSLDGRDGMIFHTFVLQDRCVRLPAKNLVRGMPEIVVLEELEYLYIRIQGVTQLISSPREQVSNKKRPTTLHFIVSVQRGFELSKVRFVTELCGLRVSVESYVDTKSTFQYKRYQRFRHTQRNSGNAFR